MVKVPKELWLFQLDSLPSPQSLAKEGEGIFLTNPEFACIPNGRGQGQPYPIT